MTLPFGSIWCFLLQCRKNQVPLLEELELAIAPIWNTVSSALIQTDHLVVIQVFFILANEHVMLNATCYAECGSPNDLSRQEVGGSRDELPSQGG